MNIKLDIKDEHPSRVDGNVYFGARSHGLDFYR